MRDHAFRKSEGRLATSLPLTTPNKWFVQLITRVNDDCALNAVFVASVPVKVMV